MRTLNASKSRREELQKKLAEKLRERYTDSWIVCDGCQCNLLDPRNSTVPVHITFAILYAGKEAWTASLNPASKGIGIAVDFIQERCDADISERMDEYEVAEAVIQGHLSVEMVDTDIIAKGIDKKLQEDYTEAKAVDSDAKELDEFSGEVVFCGDCIADYNID